MQKLKILVSAYACNPLATEESYPGEAILGWNLIKQFIDTIDTDRREHFTDFIFGMGNKRHGQSLP